MVDTGSFADVLYLDAFMKLGLTKDNLTPMALALNRFTGDSISPLGTTILPVTIEEEPRAKMIMTTFMVVDLPSAYNVILSRPTLNKLKAMSCSRQISDPHEGAVTPMRLEPPEQLTKLQLIDFLRENADVFPWSPKEMLGIDLGVTQHQLNIDPEAKLVKQRLRKIDQLVDATAGYELLTFMDAFSGYNQIRMAPQDQENTAFITSRGVYCYKVMPFGLKNAGATYQRMVDKLFKHQLGRNIEVYVDDMIMKSKTASTHLADLV
ncbi:uncharacterized protein LOC135650602 [Musa acuminata AAA Group]|uniref:uncharacterized protein LOC135650602 n=1 Tax=Musa acuminata AAA Group TaxID=214697 RepID=UPI0031CEB0F2